MALYDFRCEHCDGIFEQARAIQDRNADTQCPYCHKITSVTPMMTGGHTLAVKNKWRPSSKIEELTGQRAGGPGTNPKAKRTSVLHACKGYNCSICKT